MREDVGQRTVWRQHGRRWRTFARIWLPFTGILLIAMFLLEDMHWGTRLLAGSNFIAAACFMVMARIESSADPRGIEVTQLRTRRLPWAAVEELRPNAASWWATPVQARLTDGTTVPLPGVPVSDLRCLEELRASQTGPFRPGH